ncbi:MAG: HAD-IIB family hydrolase [Eubacteriales bacterium]|nr:HAD-IIB family hydrolase [Eubacteriales bacterium]
MGKFDGVLIASDFDNTMVYTEGALRSGEEMPAISRENCRAIEYFMAQGGIFSVATGRALPSFEKVYRDVPMNGPTVLFNGAAIYDFTTRRYLHTAFLPDDVRHHIKELLTEFPGLAFEIYHDDNSIHAVNPNELTARHLHLTHSPTVTLDSIEKAPLPISKLLFEEYEPVQRQIIQFFRRQGWGGDYEVVSSSNFLLEITARGANKGGMVRKLAELLHVEQRHVYCVGDHANDVPMLEFANVPFAPQNAIEVVHQVPGVHILPDCRENAIAAMIREIDSMYS